jgi:hypothetical protein
MEVKKYYSERVQIFKVIILHILTVDRHSSGWSCPEPRFVPIWLSVAGLLRSRCSHLIRSRCFLIDASHLECQLRFQQFSYVSTLTIFILRFIVLKRFVSPSSMLNTSHHSFPLRRATIKLSYSGISRNLLAATNQGDRSIVLMPRVTRNGRQGEHESSLNPGKRWRRCAQIS